MTRRALLLALVLALLPSCREADAGVRDAPVVGPAASVTASGDTSARPASLDKPVEGGGDDRYRGMATIERFLIDRWEAHLVACEPGKAPVRHAHDQRLLEGVRYEARSERGVFPQAYISKVEAESACVNAGKRLCSRREWQRACRGDKGAVYPYGMVGEPGRCNTDKPHLLTLRFGADARRWTYARFNDPSLSREPGFLARAGEYERCIGESGVADLVGNLHEWVSDVADRGFKARIDAEGVPRSFQYWSSGNGVFMGGFYSTHGELGAGCTFTTVAHDVGYHDYSTGFRCCADVP